MPDRPPPPKSRTDEEEAALFKAHTEGPDPAPSKAHTPDQITVRVNPKVMESKFMVGSFVLPLKALPPLLAEKIEPLLTALEPETWVCVWLRPETSIHWHRLAWWILRQEIYRNAEEERQIRADLQRTPAPHPKKPAITPLEKPEKRVIPPKKCSCLDCGKDLPPPFSWCLNPKCPGFALYTEIVGHPPAKPKPQLVLVKEQEEEFISHAEKKRRARREERGH